MNSNKQPVEQHQPGPIGRVTKYLHERKKMHGIDPLEIHGLHRGDERETLLLVQDLEALVQMAQRSQANSIDS